MIHPWVPAAKHPKIPSCFVAPHTTAHCFYHTHFLIQPKAAHPAERRHKLLQTHKNKCGKSTQAKLHNVHYKSRHTSQQHEKPKPSL